MRAAATSLVAGVQFQAEQAARRAVAERARKAKRAAA